MTARRAAFWVLIVTKAVASWGLTWDIQWHVTIGRDSFWIAPHVMVYTSVAVAFAISFAVLAWDTRFGTPHDVAPWRVLGFTSSRGFHLAAWGMALVVLAAPIDDLWHRLFGIDVTLWSPPHLLGLGGAALNTLGCLVIACEIYRRGARVGVIGALLAGGMLYGGFRVVLEPAPLLAFAHGGVLFFAFSMLGALLLPLPLVVATRLVERRWAPIACLVVSMLLGVSGDVIARLGFAILRPESFITEEIQKDPTSAIAQARTIADKNRTPPPAWARYLIFVAGAAMVALDARRRAISAGIAFAVVLFATHGWYLTLRPAFQPIIPGTAETAVALVVTIAAAVVSAAAGRLLADRLEGPAAVRPEAALAQPVA